MSPPPMARRAASQIVGALGLLSLGAVTSVARLSRAQASDPVRASVAREPSHTSPLVDSLSGDAKRDYELGRLLYDNGDFAGALLRFENARKLSGDARLLWNAAVCEKALRRYARAAAAMRAFLSRSSEGMSDETRASARDFAEAAESLTAVLVVTSNVAGADVYVDSEPLGRLPLREPARVDWGTHEVVVRRSGYIGYTQTVSISGSAVTRVVAVLRPVVHEGRVVIRTIERQTIAVDGRTVGWGSWEGALASGRHWLRVSGEGFRPYERQIVVIDNQTQGFDIVPERAARSSLPSWVWLVGGGVLAAGAVTAGYFVFRPDPARPPTPGSLATVQLELH